MVVLAAAYLLAVAAVGWLPAIAAAQPATAVSTIAPVSAAVPVSTAASTQAFSDVQGDEWFAEAVSALAAEGIVKGREDGSFGPNDAVSRAHMAMFLARVLKLPESVWQPFTDVTTQDAFAGAVGALYQRGLIQGTTGFLFSPAEPVTRQQAASLVMRCLGFAAQSDAGLAVECRLAEDKVAVWLAGFRDRALIAPDHVLSVANAYRLGVIDNPVDGWFYPGLNLTRAQMAVMIYRAFLQPVATRNAYPLELPAVSAYSDQSVGSQGALVSFLEARLAALRYPCGPVDGVYDSRTRDAVMAFEKVERLKRDGTVGPEVWQRLFTAQAPTPRRSLGGTRCEVDLTRQVLMMITDDRVWKVLHVSTGRLGTQTGHHQIRAKYEGWVKCVTLDGKMYYPSYIVSKTAIHGYESVPPYPASHGCVRVPVWTAVELYNQLPKGTPVDVYY
ncbi:MAG: S-layer homology domain-containing protein [Thermoleophilia bacterium]|nr:S-layer homology domain-containing protein [Thermoleophilia bacterium]